MAPCPALVWFRNDLRLADNPALDAAARRGGPVVPIFVWAPDEEGDWAPASATRWWLHQSLGALDAARRRLGSRLVIRRGDTLTTLLAAAEEAGADAVFWNRRYEPAVTARDTKVKTGLRQRGLTAESFNGSLLFEPWDVRTKQGKPFQVFTPFWKTCLALPPPAAPLPAPDRLVPPPPACTSLSLRELALEPTIDWAAGMRAAWLPGEEGAAARLGRFLGPRFAGYADDRDRPDHDGTSGLSPYLHFGELSPRQVWHAVGRALAKEGRRATSDPQPYLRQLGWREFAHHLLYHFPHTTDRPLRPEFDAFPWGRDDGALRAWRRGRTGYPLVDAGMRQLWATGWMHNRVRMVAASFLVKDLLLPWTDGAKWFWDTLVDADLANNTLGWQWVAGCGADAAPYFRVFNPVSQAEKFDPDGAYVRRWVPELARLPSPWVHKPWEAPPDVLAGAGVALGKTYPSPIVDHSDARQRALDAYHRLREEGAG